jgi:hypothetical protein
LLRSQLHDSRTLSRSPVTGMRCARR